MSDAAERFTRANLEAMAEYEHATVAQDLATYQPTLEAEFGKPLAELFLNHPGLIDRIREIYEDTGVEADGIADSTVRRLRDNPDTTVDEALASVHEWLLDKPAVDNS